MNRNGGPKFGPKFGIDAPLQADQMDLSNEPKRGSENSSYKNNVFSMKLLDTNTMWKKKLTQA